MTGRNIFRSPATYAVMAALCFTVCAAMTMTHRASPLTLAVFAGLGCAFILLFCAFRARVLDEKRGRRTVLAGMWFCLIIYSALLLNLTLFSAYYGRAVSAATILSDGVDAEKYLEEHLKLRPFGMITYYISAWANGDVSSSWAIRNLFGNILAFMPFGFLLPGLFRGLRRFWRFALCCVFISLAIELLQLVLMAGTCDVDDVILNASGGCIAFALTRLAPIKEMIHKLLPPKP